MLVHSELFTKCRDDLTPALKEEFRLFEPDGKMRAQSHPLKSTFITDIYEMQLKSVWPYSWPPVHKMRRVVVF